MNNKLPDIIYKYRNWTDKYHKRILTHREVYLASPKDLNDPFDCRITPNFDLLDNDDKIKDYIKVIGDRNRGKLAASGQKPEDFQEELFDRLKNNRQEEQKNWDGQTYRGQDERYGIFSLSGRWNSILMWGHYSASHSGFCVGFHEKKMADSGQFGRGGLINYGPNFPQIHPSEDYTPERGFTETFSKAQDWSYEQEYRLFKFLKSPKESRLIVVDSSFFAEIILGLNFPEGSLPEMFEISDALKIPIYKIVKVPWKFELDRVKIK
ncbi:MAG: DUF2971 domain-containing protein [Cytophagales bacterium]|jgi:hypothetical protein|nr:DUF2971 domain-containing protein [Cytophagales bacterium]MCA6373955.1 DUF2971 domain-containing protein [Cytophagales bacterium]MCA6376444.1 DUF2971 domain-containing protein [Cytophagales bacterium]MCA6383864.1 DUF2971 domain-containing protein [Cytophagales bacterium]